LGLVQSWIVCIIFPMGYLVRCPDGSVRCHPAKTLREAEELARRFDDHGHFWTPYDPKGWWMPECPRNTNGGRHEVIEETPW
jgi:hypothetical protein